ncbi:hypothetical protein Syun_019086 [Stephania yunnanensis]|uniref:Uncharacterized protein n=1 Tax=Stephania yunnanensis TaxID=152371 RepID=A0AAP0ITG6_9MAGN
MNLTQIDTSEKILRIERKREHQHGCFHGIICRSNDFIDSKSYAMSLLIDYIWLVRNQHLISLYFL